ncbi:sugar transporter ERD6-like 5 [Chrysoperla carnea]|uniref:sugar transporter ERD6-like 5 n=1 Tax=Chrysoperla carnea TaxID=189513 RepID=UPI001D0656D0|nr:sugar transporter ERD6-like 5 [Chrysoperla carnea]
MVLTTVKSYFNKKYLQQYISVMAASLVFFVCGNQMGTMSPYLVILNVDGYHEVPKISSLIVSWLSSIYNIGILFGALMSTYANDILGRKLSMILFTFPALLSQIFQYFAVNISMVFISLFLRGITSSWAFSVVPTYISEIALPHLRGPFTVLGVLIMSLGMLSGSLIQASFSIELSALIGGISVLVTLVLVCVISETPYFFISKNKDAKCKESLRKFRCEKIVDKEYEEIKSSWNETLAIKQEGWVKIFTVPLNLKVVFICVGVQTCQQFTALTTMVTNIHTIVQHYQLDLSLTQISIMSKGVETFTTIISIFVIDSWGRRPLFLFVSLGACIAHFITGLAFVIANINGEISTTVGITAFIGNLIYLAISGLGLKHLPNVLGAELFTTDIRSKGCSLLMVISAIEGAIVALLFDFLFNMANYLPFLIFSACGFLGFVFGVIWVPETRSKSLAEIQRQLKCN